MESTTVKANQPVAACGTAIASLKDYAANHPQGNVQDDPEDEKITVTYYDHHGKEKFSRTTDYSQIPSRVIVGGFS